MKLVIQHYFVFQIFKVTICSSFPELNKQKIVCTRTMFQLCCEVNGYLVLKNTVLKAI